MARRKVRTTRDSSLRKFLRNEAAGGILLMGVAALAMIIANSPLYETYHHILHDEIGPTLTPKLGPMAVHQREEKAQAAEVLAEGDVDRMEAR